MALPDAPTFAGRGPMPPRWSGSDPGLELPMFEKNVRLWVMKVKGNRRNAVSDYCVR